MTCAASLSFTINDSSVSVLIFVETNASFISFSGMFFSLQVEIPSESECLCPNLGMSCARLVVPTPSVSLRRLDRIISGVLMAVVVGILYG